MPLIASGIVTVLAIFASIYAGYGLFNLLKKHNSPGIIEPSGTAVGALMGLLAFMLAFAFSMGAGRLDVRKTALLQEINAIGTLYLRTDLLETEQKEEYREVLREYVKLRVDLVNNPKEVGKTIQRADEIALELWQKTFAHVDTNRSDITSIALMDATNEVIDSYEERVFQGTQHMPIIIWVALIAMTILAMVAMGYQLGVSGKMSHLVNVLMALTFAGTLMMIADLDRYDEGFFVIPQDPIERLYESILPPD